MTKEVGKRIRQLRTARFNALVTLEELASRTGLSVSHLSMLERGERSPGLDALGRIADSLGVPLAQLFDFDADPAKVDPLYRPLVEYCRRQSLTRRDVDKLVAIARVVFG